MHLQNILCTFTKKITMNVYVYTLEHPTTKEIRYVGKTKNPKMRFQNHMNKGHNKTSHKTNWIESLKREGLRPVMKVLDEVSNEEWKYWEKFWIALCTEWGFSLTNHTSGGEGLSFANKSSFKKGNVPWNNGTANIKKCVICDTKFKNSKSAKKSTCSKKCASIIRSEATKNTQFKKGEKVWNKNKPGYKTSKRKPVLQYDLNGNFIKEFECCKDASIEMDCIPENIRRACIGKSKTAKGYKWKYKLKTE